MSGATAITVIDRPPQPRSLFRRFPHRSLRIRLLAIVLILDCAAAALTGAVIILQARTATKLEIASSMQLAEVLAADTISIVADAPSPLRLQSIHLPFRSLRHVKISVTDIEGRTIEDSYVPPDPLASQGFFAEAPGWFIALIAPPIETKVFPIIVGQERIGDMTIRSEPNDEIDEAWNYAHSVLVTDLCVNLAVLGALFLLYGRVLAPLTNLVAGLKKLEGKNYSVRLERPTLLELAEITDHFNRAAEALSIAHQANRHLNRKIVTAHDDERRRTGLELHDDVGPCLFALEASAASIVSIAKQQGENTRLHERAQEVISLVHQVQGINRQLLNGLRPMALGRIPLKDCIVQLVVDFSGDAGPAIEYMIGELRDGYGYLVDLTLYRCTQEGLFNAVRHAQASRITLTLEEGGVADHPFLALNISDNGKGFNQRSREGIGLSGIRERVEALSGSFELWSSPDGTSIAIILPLDTADDLQNIDPRSS